MIIINEKVKNEKSYFDTFDDSCFCRDVVFLSRIILTGDDDLVSGPVITAPMSANP